MRFIYLILSTIFFYPLSSYASDLSHASDVRFDPDIKPPSPRAFPKEKSPQVKKLLFLKELKSSKNLSYPSTPRTPRTPKIDFFEGYSVQVHYIRYLKEESKTKTLYMTPSKKPLSRKKSLDSDDFLKVNGEKFLEAFPSCDPSHSLIVYNTFKNRKLLAVTFYITPLETAIKDLLKTEGSFAHALHKHTPLKDKVRETDYLLSETAHLRKSWKPFIDNINTVLLFLNKDESPPMEMILQLPGRYEDYQRRYGRYLATFSKKAVVQKRRYRRPSLLS